MDGDGEREGEEDEGGTPAQVFLRLVESFNSFVLF